MNLQGRVLELVAGAYVLGTLGPRARRRFEALLTQDVAARRAWQRWEERFAGLGTDIPPVRPSDRSWAHIEKRLAQKQGPRAKSQLRWLLAAALVAGIAFYMVWKKVRP